MGCVQSQPEPSPSPQVHNKSKATAGAQKLPTAKKQSSQKPLQSSNKSKARPSVTPKYDTQSTASFSEDGNGGAYFGILKGGDAYKAVSKVAVEGSKKSRVVVGRSKQDDSSATKKDTSAEDVLRVEGLAMTMRWVVIAERKEREAQQEEAHVRNIVEEVMKVCNETWNIYNEESELSRLNLAKSGKKVSISNEMKQVFDLVGKLVELSNHRFDPTTGCIKAKVLHLLENDKRPPNESDLASLRFAIGWINCLAFNEKNQTILKKNTHTVIDLNGVVKGYTVDLVCRKLRETGYRSYYVDWSGDIGTAGRHPSGRPWRTAVMNPPTIAHLFDCWQKDRLQYAIPDNDVAYLVDLERQVEEDGQLAVCTSGDYFSVMKYGFHHIVRSDTLSVMKTSNASVASVTVVASNCAIADALATAAMTFDTVSSARHFLKQLEMDYPDLSLSSCIIGRDGSCEASSLFRDGRWRTESPAKQPAAPKINHAQLQKMSLRCAPTAVGCLRTKGGMCEIDSLRTLSVESPPLVSLLISDDKEQCKYLRNAKDRSCTFQYAGRIEYCMRVNEIVDLPSAALVVAQVEKVALVGGISLNNPSLQLKDGDQREGFPLELSKIDGILSTTNIVEDIKAVERFVPTALSLLVTKSVEDETHGLTATSAVISSHNSSILTFNMGKNTVFSAVLGGIGSYVSVFFLKKGHESIAETHTTKSVVDAEVVEHLRVSATKVEVRVRSLIPCADHVLIAADVVDISEASKGTKPLLWYDRHCIEVG